MRTPILGFFISALTLIIISWCCLNSVLPQDILNPTPSKITQEVQVFSTVLPSNPDEPAIRTPLAKISEDPAGMGEVNINRSVTYDIVNSIKLSNNGPGDASVDMVLALIHSLPPYQEVLSQKTEENYTPLSDSDGNQYANIKIDNIPAGKTREISISYQVLVNGLTFDLGNCIGPVINKYNSPEKYIESDSQSIINLAKDLSEGEPTMCDQAQAFYDYVGDNMEYGGYNAADWGAETALENLTGDCTEYSDLTAALSRASGIPARSIDGITCCTQNGYQEGQNKHNWLETYFPGSGWVPLDPTWGRSPNQRKKYFAAITPDHIIVTQGKSPELLGGYHYFYYNYSWDAESADVVSQETWSILEAK
jgi:transglutaminase-like putative cysteine protease